MRFEEARAVFLHHWTYTAGANEAKFTRCPTTTRSWSSLSQGNASVARPTCKASVRSTQQFNSTSSRARSGEAGTSGSGRAGRCMTGANPVHFVHILEFRGDLVQRESIYFAEPFPAQE